ncbi:MAG: hypothetical protein AAF501_17515 [Pseudomonadota bacterium]
MRAEPDDTPPRQPGLRRFVRPLLGLVSLAMLLYLGWILASAWPEVSQWRAGPGDLVLLVSLAAGYGAALLLVAETWHGLISRLSGLHLPRVETYRSVTETQLGKYLPGNVAHLIGRHVWLRQAGPSHRALGGALVAEAGALVAGAGLLAACIVIALPIPYPPSISDIVKTGAVCVTAGALVAVILASVISRCRPWRGIAARSVALTMVFFILQGTAFWGVAALITDHPPAFLIGLSAIAWIAGFLMPGAPGGLGPRELVLVMLAAPAVGQADAALAAAIFRIVTLAGDGVCFGLGRALFRPAGNRGA